MKHRKQYYPMLQGVGLEIGALHEPAPLPASCECYFFDLRSREDSIALFDELDPAKIVEVDFVGDIDRRDLRRLGARRFDFVIANHVIEHLANPIALVEDLFHLVKPGGLVVLSAPDKDYTYDRKREITPFEHVLRDYREGCLEADRSHYLDFIENVLPGGTNRPPEDMEALLDLVKRRREHVHVWTSESFKRFLENCFDLLGIQARPLVESYGEATRFEYFSIWEKQRRPWWKRLGHRLFASRSSNRSPSQRSSS